MKKCLKCKCEYQIGFFYKVGKYYNSYCKKCLVKENYKNVFKRFGTNNLRKTPYAKHLREVDKKWQAKRRKENPVWKSEDSKEYNKNNPEKAIAYKEFHSAIRKGILKKEKCRDCERIDVHGHHPDYLKPLEVIWLCPIHHKLEHQKIGR